MTNNGDNALACMLAITDELAVRGATVACLSPGSRSTPLALALARHPAIETRIHLDERASAYFAVGRARATGMPSILACTSGTATANYLPAVIEASLARVPLIVLTADRPPELHGTGANQTIDQRGLYGDYVRLFVDAHVPSDSDAAADYWRGIAARAHAAACDAPAGPVHVNIPFREPLIPAGARSKPAQTGPPAPSAVAVPQVRVQDTGILANLVTEHERGIVLAGALPTPAPAVFDLCAAAGWPLIAEPLSNLRAPGYALHAGQSLIGCTPWIEEHMPDVVLQVGAAPTTRAGLTLAGAARRLVTVDPDGWPADPARNAERIVRADPDALARTVAARARRRDTRWLDTWLAADAIARRTLDDVLDGVEEPFEPRIARDVAASLPDGATLFVGNSTPVRDLDLAMAPRSGLRVLGNRGASGIDGLVSTAFGIASAGTATTALIGDLSLLHDVGSFLWTRDIPLDLIVIDNGGGGIFDLLPSATLPEHERIFVTPHGLDLRAVLGDRATVHRVRRAFAVETRSALRHAVAAAVMRRPV